ncbi:unnamed protein product [Leptidea sinapis]|uniref:Uncharacterized protein n=1 Tax=Leptidea sinapis TaxID=189913 RepID=A0A5E4R7X7_9NEOP|nr:unnamed protein product [Leptidea sinapis]
MDTLSCDKCRLVVNECLSFCVNTLDSIDNVSLALLCRQSFDEEEIFKAKRLLFETIPQRLVKRKGEDRKQKNIEDIISVLRSTEPDDIPTFVAKDLHKLPPVTFDHIDILYPKKNSESNIKFLEPNESNIPEHLRTYYRYFYLPQTS